jgi:uncharacterized OB-fold protein
MKAENGNIVESWKARFRHSAGRLGSEYLRALRDEARLLGWRVSRTAKVLFPPKDLGEPGEFVEVGPGARLLTLARDVSFAGDTGRVVCLGRVALDGASMPLFARVAFDEEAAPRPGARLSARFASTRVGAATDFWFEPERR